ncbi:BQ5605_C038g11741 [Microbotryum silenes-dioicae]|uniref:BQ5605_C002g01820 protein n=1 Tax=Microbotryum silenes-dioicae TaxID=796604 RepID=A0A2X0M468_9BASI|nr:BQ5605_C002g01820 [Microbotryum silenes-dioicae]SGY59954.1 BQ5605_C007g04365 [Microbotryum silenes-dioicae]SGY92476.1 BQ5605_C038g11741 [Microbotryum silenes-dioicae]
MIEPSQASSQLSNTAGADAITDLHYATSSEAYAQESDRKDAGEQKLGVPASSSPGHTGDDSSKVSTQSHATKILRTSLFSRDLGRTCVAFAIVFMVGFHVGATGLNLSLIREHYNLAYEQVSIIFLFACGACPYLIQYVGLQWALVVSCTTWCVACLVLVVQPPFPVLVLAFATLAAGAGLYEALLTTVISHNKDPGTYYRRLVIMSWLYANFAVGAACAPIVVGSFVAHEIGWNKFYIVLLSLSLGLAVFAHLVFWGYVSPSETVVKEEADSAAMTDTESQRRSEAGGTLDPASVLKVVNDNAKGGHLPTSTTARLSRLLRLKIVWLGLALLCLAYATTDLLAAWMSTYLLAVKHASKPASKYLLSGYWAGVACGRLLLPWALYRRLGERLFASVLLLIAASMLIIMWVVKSYELDAVALAVCGFVIGPISPHGLSTISSWVPAALRPSVVAFTLACAVTCGGIAPLLCGFVAGKGWLSSLPSCLIVMCVLAAGAWLLVPKTHEEVLISETTAV